MRLLLVEEDDELLVASLRKELEPVATSHLHTL